MQLYKGVVYSAPMSNAAISSDENDLQSQLTMREIAEAAGGYNALGRTLGISATAVWQWKRVPSERVRAVEKATGISRYAIRPDIYGPDPRVP